MSKDEKILVLNIATDAKDTSLGFAISWLNVFSDNYSEVDVITLKKGDTSNLNNNVNIYNIGNSNKSKITKAIKLFKLINKVTKESNYKYCLSHMSPGMIAISSIIFRIRQMDLLLWYTHKGPTNFFGKVILFFGYLSANKIITASDNSFPYKSKKVNVIGHAIDYKTFYKKIESFSENDFAIVSRISKSKNIEESIKGFLKSKASESFSLVVIGGALTNEDKNYYEYLLNKYRDNKNISFIGPVPHSELVNYLKNVRFHINNTDKGFYDKSVLETSVNGIINFYKNIDYDKNIPTEYQEVLKFDGSSSDLSNKISSVFTLNQNEFLKIIEHSQKEINNESLDTLVKRIESVI
tara:strand:+ start:726 stop:1784 length:1059 start_codon:yes stop_codon:yes gene_type:complete